MNMKKAGGGHTRHGLPFLRCLHCCSREAINRQKLREANIFDIWSEVLKRSVPTTSKTSVSEADQLVLEAKKIILTSLTNFYYDDESIKEMLRHQYCFLLSSHIPETLIHVKPTSDIPKTFNAAGSSDLPEFYHNLERLPSECAPSTSLQIMKRLQTGSSSDSDTRPDSPGWSPPNTPPRRQFKRRRRTNRSPSSSDASDGDGTYEKPRDPFSGDDKSPDAKLS